VHDLGMVGGWVNSANWTLVTPAYTVLLLCQLLSVNQFLIRSLGRAERANEELEQNIAAKTQQLEASFALLRQTELEAERKAAQDSARKEEREHLLREMHDGLGAQLMTALRGVERGGMSTDQVSQALQDSLDDLRLLMDSADLGRELQGALASWRNRWDPRLQALGIALIWRVDSAIERVDLGADAVLQLMRILQEATANAVKHAACHQIELHAELLPAGSGNPAQESGHAHRLRMRICDDGQGLPSAPLRPGGRGLVNMRARAQLLGAKLHSGNRPPPTQGHEVVLDMPVLLKAADPVAV
jgi:signal transduction histidine kinase